MLTSALTDMAGESKTPTPKKGAKQLCAPKTACPETLVAISEISLEEDSGWRPIDPNRVRELKDAFVRGEYGQNLLRKPSLLWFSGAPKLSTNGLGRLADGKATFAALKELQIEYQQHLEKDTLEDDTYSETLIRAFTDGVDVMAIEFEDDDDCLVLAWATGAHDLESNKYKASSLKDIVSVAQKYRVRQPGGSWQATQTALERIYGPKRRMWGSTVWSSRLRCWNLKSWKHWSSRS